MSNNSPTKHYDLSQIYKAEQTPIFFCIPQNIIDKKGSSSLITCTTRAEKQQWTVMFPLMADSKKLLPYIIFKGKRIPKGIEFHIGIHVMNYSGKYLDR